MTRRFGVALAVLAGAGMALQARINGELGTRLGDGVAAACISFSSGLILLSCVALFVRADLRSLTVALRKGELRWWQCVGGVCGAFLVATQGLAVGVLGVAVFSVAVIAGQVASGLAVDRAGLAPGAARPVTTNRALGALLCVLAVLAAVFHKLGDINALAWAALPLLAGVGIAWQQAMNGQVRQASGGVIATTFVNFLVGTAVLLLVWLPTHGPVRTLPGEPWLYLGGTLGIVFIAIAAAVVKRIGVLLLGLGTVAGQICGALVIDSVAGYPVWNIYLGAGLTLAAVVLASLPGRASRV